MQDPSAPPPSGDPSSPRLNEHMRLQQQQTDKRLASALRANLQRRKAAQSPPSSDRQD